MSNDLMRTTTDADRRDEFDVEQTGDGDAERGTRGVTRSMMAPLVLQAVGSTPVVVVAIVLLVIVLLVWVWMRGDKQKRGDESRPQLEEGEKPSGDILEQREEVDEPVDVDEDMSLAEVKKAKMAKVRGEDKERRKAGVATEEAREEHADQDEADRAEPEEAEEAETEEPEAEQQEAEDAELEEPADELAEEDVSEPDDETDEEAADESADEAEAEAGVEVEEDDSPGLGIPDPSDAGLVDESEADQQSGAADEQNENEGRERKGSGISVPTPDDVSESDIGTSPDEDEGVDQDSDEEADEAATEEPEEAADDETTDDEATDDEGPEEKPSEEEAADDEPAEDEASDESEEDEPGEDEGAEDEADEPKTLEKGLEKTREGLIGQLSSLFTGDTLDDEIVEEVEEVLITADVGPKVTRKIIDALEEQLEGEEKNDPGKVWGFIRRYTKELLEAHEDPLDVDADKPFVILVVGVNGVGKTTTIGKMASKFKRQGKSVMLVAGDTFRAGAVDQLGIWAERTDLPMHKGDEGADPASVIYGGIERGIEEGTDVVICDTSGRLHTDKNLMEELKKMERVAGNAKEGAPHEVHLVLDANTGQNAIAQAEKFFEALDVSGMTLTKFDGTARGGVILGVCDRFEAPVRYVGIGEHVADLREFDAEEFVEALFM